MVVFDIGHHEKCLRRVLVLAVPLAALAFRAAPIQKGTMNTGPLRCVALAAALLLKPLTGYAQAPEDDSLLRQNCAGDYFRFCSSYLPGSKEIRQCFASKIDQLSPE